MAAKKSRFATYPSLAGRVVFISGGGSGIGASFVEHFCGQGAKVAFCDIAEAPSRALVKRIARSSNSPPLFIPCDLRDIEALRATIGQAAKALGTITVLVNNAARDDRHEIEDVTPEYWDERYAVNVKHQFFAAQAVHPGMKKAGGGSIVNMGSTSWMLGVPNMPAYVSAKSAVTGLTRGLARRLGPDKIRVNTVLPGWVMTERQRTLWLTPEGDRKIDENQCLIQRLMPADIARMVLFLAADDSQMCTNQSYIVDGGWI
jgi:NAD(P)-dependent dehydrogenase (short-subunit alcohol dehydrogenase family)